MGMNVLDPDVDAAGAWARAARHDERGATYLASRELWPEVLELAGVVRYTRWGAPAVALRHLAIGEAVVNVVHRNLPEDVRQGRAKALGMRGAPTSGVLVGDVDQIVDEQRDAVVCEGVADALAACLMWPFAVVCGAHGAGRLAEVAAEVAPRCRHAGTRLHLVADADVTGFKAGVKAAEAAIAAGLHPGFDLVEVDLEGAKDLAELWQRRWR
jgi:Toprim domain-containing protein